MTNLTVKGYFDKPEVQKKFNELLGENKTNFITSAMQVVQGNDMLKKADPTTVFNAITMAAVLNLPINSNLGFAYILPYSGKAQFQLGYKGFIQLAIRSGEYKTIGSTPIYENQIIECNPLTGYQFDFTVKDKGEIKGFAASFTLKNGFEKVLFMTTSEITAHGKKYSKSYHKDSSIWKKDPHGMAMKTVLKLLLSKYGVLSLEMQKAVDSDQSIVVDADSNEFEYPDNDGKLKNDINDQFHEAEVVDSENSNEDPLM